MLRSCIMVVGLLSGCRGDLLDLDNDGVRPPEDCDDGDVTVHPDADEVADGKDQDCDGLVDEGTYAYFEDQDGDLYTDAEWGGEDCDDTDPAVNPGLHEACRDGVDNDCKDELGECALPGVLSLRDASSLTEGGDEYDDLGARLAEAGDADGDGISDIWAASPSADARAGAIWLIEGEQSGISTVDEARVALSGEITGGRLGADVVGGLDWDGDSYVDVVVGAPANADAGPGGVLLFDGPFTGPLGVTAAALSLAEPDGVNGFGAGLIAGDVDDDDFPDLLVTYTSGEDAGGALLLYPGALPAGSNVAPEAANADWVLPDVDVEGLALESADFDADGHSDIAVGQPFAGPVGGEKVGGVQVLAGSDGLAIAATLWGESPFDQAGAAVACPGDTNDDGYDDLLVGAPFADPTLDEAGVVYLLIGPLRADGDLADAEATFQGEERGDRLGETLGAAGNFDGDANGWVDLVVGAPRHGAADEGAFYVFAGPIPGNTRRVSEADYRFDGPWEGGRLGAQLLGGLDRSGDSYPDLVVSAPDAGPVQQGLVLTFLGAGQ